MTKKNRNLWSLQANVSPSRIFWKSFQLTSNSNMHYIFKDRKMKTHTALFKTKASYETRKGRRI